MTKYLLVFALIFLFPLYGWTCECSDKLSPEIEEFIFQTWKTATVEKLSQHEREERYELLKKRLISKAHEVRVPAERLEQLAEKCIRFEETYRSVPQSLDRSDKAANLVYFTEITRIILPIHLEMIGYCHQFCPKG